MTTVKLDQVFIITYLYIKWCLFFFILQKKEKPEKLHNTNKHDNLISWHTCILLYIAIMVYDVI